MSLSLSAAAYKACNTFYERRKNAGRKEFSIAYVHNDWERIMEMMQEVEKHTETDVEGWNSYIDNYGKNKINWDNFIHPSKTLKIAGYAEGIEDFGEETLYREMIENQDLSHQYSDI
jgi:hypothetical protein